MPFFLSQTDPQLVAFLAVLAAAGGADLALTIMVLGIMPRLGWADPPGALVTLQAPAVVVSVALLYVAEAAMERFPGGFALWHTFQRWVRVVALLLLTSMATAAVPPLERGVLVGAATLLGVGVYMGASGWEGIFILRRLSNVSQRLSALAIDVAFGALLVLALDEPRQAVAALGILLLAAASQLPLAVRAHLALVRAGRAWLHALVLPGRWVQENDLPPGIRALVSTEGPIPGKPLRGARATLLTRRIRIGWLVLASHGPLFVEPGKRPIPLQAVPGTAAVPGPLHVRKPVRADGEEGEILVLKDGPGVGDLERSIPAMF